MSFSFFATLLWITGLTLILGAIFLSIWRYRSQTENNAATPDDFGPKLTSARLHYVRWAFALMVVAAFGFHVYWSLFAAGPIRENEDFSQLKNTRDQRLRREGEITLRGWVFDRHHDHKRTLAKYRYLNGKIIRDYPLGRAASHLIGYTGLLRGDAMMERALLGQVVKEPEIKWYERLFGLKNKSQMMDAGRDITLTVDYDLQREAAALLEGKRGAAVMLNPQTGEILALASAPTFDPGDIENDITWQQISRDVKNRPLLNRALHEYYLPGSTLKTVTAAAAIESRIENKTFFCQGAGWTPPGSSRPIRDDEGEAHGNIRLADAFAVSCNQYFAQLGSMEVERERMGQAAERFGLKVFSTGEASIGPGQLHHAWNSENKVLIDIFAPLISTFVSSNKISKYDLGLESIGQGYVQLTPLQMAMVAAACANEQGRVMKPTLEMNRAPVQLSEAMTPQTAASMRQLMAGVVERGTARGAVGSIVNGRFTVGGKTGTAQREVPVIDPRTEKPVTYVDSRGRERIRRENRIDSWFIGFAPVDKPKVAFAVVVESGGYGARTSAPIAAKLLVKAGELKLLGEQINIAPSPATPSATPANNAPRRANPTATKPARSSRR